MRTFLAAIVVTIVVLALAAQLALPAYLEGRVEDRYEKGGGSAEVSLSALPAVTLLVDSGRELRLSGERLTVDLTDGREKPFERLDGFERVDVHLTELDGGPLQIERFELERDARDEHYALRLRAAATPRDVAAEAGALAAGRLARLAASLAAATVPRGGRIPVSIAMRARVRSEDGSPRVSSSEGSVGGLPAGPLAEIVLGVVLRQL